MTLRTEGEKSVKKMPFALRALLAQLGGNDRAATASIQQGLSEISDKLTKLASGYDTADLPLVIAAMELTAKALRPTLNEGGRRVTEEIIKNTEFITVSIGAALGQMGGDGGGDKEKR